MEFKDKVLTCRDCGAEFVFTAGEQEFYAEKGFQHEPVRCRDCRMARKRQRNDGPREMYPVVCSACGRDAEVPSSLVKTDLYTAGSVLKPRNHQAGGARR